MPATAAEREGEGREEEGREQTKKTWRKRVAIRFKVLPDAACHLTE